MSIEIKQDVHVFLNVFCACNTEIIVSVNERLYEVSLGACPPDYVVEDHALRLVNLTVCAHHPLTASSAVPRLIFFNTERIREN